MRSICFININRFSFSVSRFTANLVSTVDVSFWVSPGWHTSGRRGDSLQEGVDSIATLELDSVSFEVEVP